jgi:hypothetical protein
MSDHQVVYDDVYLTITRYNDMVLPPGTCSCRRLSICEKAKASEIDTSVLTKIVKCELVRLHSEEEAGLVRP